MQGRYVSYLRVSTDRQGRSGLGLEAQRAAVAAYLDGGNWSLLSEFVEVEHGDNNERPELAKALHLARITGATVVIAKLDRLSRDAHFLLGLEKAGVDFVAADMPHANRLTVGIMAMVADEERRMISARTKAALAAAKARGVKLGRNNMTPEIQAKGTAAGIVARKAKADAFAAGILPVVHTLRAQGMSLNGIASRLTEMGVKTARGGHWQAVQVSNLLKRTA